MKITGKEILEIGPGSGNLTQYILKKDQMIILTINFLHIKYIKIMKKILKL